MKKTTGNLITMGLEGKFDVIIHGCNCYHKMGAGIAREIKKRIPSAYSVDVNSSIWGDWKKLGSYTATKITNRHEGYLIVVNAYTQYEHWNKTDVNEDSIRKVFKLIASDFKYKRIGYPLIGCGLAGGDWSRISLIIDKELKGLDHTLVNYDSNAK